jgi:hypothetical protein
VGVGVVLLLLGADGAGVLLEVLVGVEGVVEVPLGVDVVGLLEVLGALVVAEVPVLVVALELALGRELPEHPFNRRIHNRTVINAAQ